MCLSHALWIHIWDLIPLWPGSRKSYKLMAKNNSPRAHGVGPSDTRLSYLDPLPIAELGLGFIIVGDNEGRQPRPLLLPSQYLGVTRWTCGPLQHDPSYGGVRDRGIVRGEAWRGL